MTPSLVQAAATVPDDSHFTVRVGDELRTYESSKDGKRQAILDGLGALETVTAGDDVYLPADAALQLVAAVLYPGGIETEEQYETVCRTTDKACAFAGWGSEEQLGPPAVPFSQRGAYRKREPAVDQTLVLEALENAGVSSYAPQQQVNCRIVWNKAAWAAHDKPLNNLAAPQMERLRLQADAVAEAAGWRIEAENSASSGSAQYVRPLVPNLERARQALVKCLASYNGHPVRVDTVQAHAERGAYGRSFYSDELEPALADLLRQVLDEQGYEPEPDGREYRPQRLALPGDANARLEEALAALEPAQTEFGEALIWDEVLETARRALELEHVGEWQVQQLLESGVVGEVLSGMGYRREATWCQPYHFRPRLDVDGPSSKARQIILKEIRVMRDPERKLSLADGLPVYAPAVVLDSEEDEVVYLEMVGSKQAVRANWAALVGGKVQWIGRQRIELDGMKNHDLLRSTLPCGWSDYILIHKQASLQAMNPEEPFYLLDGGAQEIPSLFYPMLNKCLAIPVLEAWADFLWARGREERLIHLLNEGVGQGYAAWRVLPALEEWQRVVQVGLETRKLAF
jgi:hypothetical protein